MVDHLEMARQYVQEMLEQRDDIVGAFVAGSVGRGEADETSDVDLRFIVEGLEGAPFKRGGIDTWREGIYIDAALVARDPYDGPETVLLEPFTATEIHDALILYDPTGHFTQVQGEVRSAFSQPKWLGARIRALTRMLRGALSRLREAVSTRDTVGMCEHAPWVASYFTSIPLIRCGITPRSMRTLTQLVTVAPEIRERICDWEGSTTLSPEEVTALLPTTMECLAIVESADSAELGQMYGEAATKAGWYAAKGLYQEALYVMWWVPGGMAYVARSRGDAGIISRERELVETWLQAVGWEGQEVLEEKVRMAEEMAAEVEALAANLPQEGD